jgi:hypothetical protein
MERAERIIRERAEFNAVRNEVEVPVVICRNNAEYVHDRLKAIGG